MFIVNRYQSASSLDGLPIVGETQVYDGDGYVAEFYPKYDNKKLLEELKQYRWIDGRTLAIVIEMAVSVIKSVMIGMTYENALICSIPLCFVSIFYCIAFYFRLICVDFILLPDCICIFHYACP